MKEQARGVQMLKCAVLLLIAAMLASCGGGNSALNPQFQPQVANQQDNFQFQSTGVKNVSQTLTYTWQNSGSAASINQASTVAAGTAFIHLLDASGKTVYSADLAANGTFSSVAGTAGAWTIQVVLSNANGTLNFRVQKM